MKILVIIVTYNGMQWIDRCIRSVEEWDVLVIDNGSTDGTKQYLKEHFPKVMLRENDTNLGFGKANNIGLQYALDKAYDFVYLMNQDAWVLPETIATMAEVMGRHPEYGVLSPMQMQADMRHMDNTFGEKVCTWKASHEMMEDWYLKTERKEVYTVPFVMAAHWMISAECLAKVGGFSPTFPHYGEDDNYLNRAAFHGFKTGIVTGARAVHDRGSRPLSREKSLYIGYYVVPLKMLSRISEQKKWLWMVLLKNIIAGIVIKKSLKPIGYMARIAREYHNISVNKKKSKGICAFLEQNHRA